MGTGIFSTGVSGLQVAQLGLQTTEHNIANATTPGFSRQRTVQASNVALQTGAGFIGQGVHVETIQRLYDGFLTAQVNRTQTASSELQAYGDAISKIDNMLADADVGLSPALQDFFSGVQAVAADPSQVTSRQAMISSAQALVSRYQTMSDQLTQIYDGVNSQIQSTVATINAYSSQVASLNQAIVLAQSAGTHTANDLLDQRDQIILELNKLVKVTTTTNTDGSLNLFIGNGQQLVVGNQVMTMTAQPSSQDPSRFVVGLKTSGGNQELPESLITGGTLGGLVNFRSQSLDRVANDLGRNAASLALTFNAQNALGQDLEGNIAGDSKFISNFFTLTAPHVAASASNTPANPDISVSYTSPPPYNGNFYTDLTSSDYRLDYDGAQLTLTRLSDNTQWSGATVAALNAVLATPGNEQGFSIDPAVFVAADAGASYLIQPTRDAARNISVNAAAAADPRLLAAAAPIRTGSAVANSGNAVISQGSVATGYVAPATGTKITLTYNAGQLTGFPSGPVSVTSGGVTTNYVYPAPDASIPYTSGATISFSGMSFEISGTPNNNDTFSIERNVAGVSDGRNALALGLLNTQNTMSGKTASYQSAYAQLVSDVGNKAREIDVKSQAQDAVLKQAQDSRDSVSGVNLDEEATNLMRYQQAYQAASKMLQVGNKLFDDLLSVLS
jgi:flagellar hook-associated protein 1 FlgK